MFEKSGTIFYSRKRMLLRPSNETDGSYRLIAIGGICDRIVLRDWIEFIVFQAVGIIFRIQEIRFMAVDLIA